MIKTPDPVRICKAQLNLSLPDHPDRQRLSQRFERALRDSLSSIPDHLLPDTDTDVHLGTLNLDLGDLELTSWSKMEGLFQQRLRQRLLELLQRTAAITEPPSKPDSGKKATAATGTIAANPANVAQKQIVAGVRQQLQALLQLTENTRPATGVQGQATDALLTRPIKKKVQALGSHLQRCGNNTALPASLRKALAQLVSDLELWLTPRPEIRQVLPELRQLLRQLRPETGHAGHSPRHDGQALLAVLDKPLQALEQGEPAVEVSCTALEAALHGLIIRRRLSPNMGVKLGLWLSRQSHLAPPIRLRRMQALHRYLRQHYPRDKPLADVQPDPFKASLLVADDKTRSVSPLPEVGDSPCLTTSPEKLPEASTLTSHTHTTLEVSVDRVHWLVDALLADPALPCQQARRLNHWRQQYGQLSPVQRYRWLEALLAQLPEDERPAAEPAAGQNVKSLSPALADLHFIRVRKKFINSWASAPVHSLDIAWTGVVRQAGESLAQVGDRLELSRIVRQLFVICSVVAERHTDMAGWLRSYRKRWQQWLRHCDPKAQKLSFTHRDQLWPDTAASLPEWSTGTLIVTIDQQLNQCRRHLKRCRDARPPMRILNRACREAIDLQPGLLKAACHTWLAARPFYPTSLGRNIEHRLTVKGRLTAQGVRTDIKAAERQLNKEERQLLEQINQWRQLAVALFSQQPAEVIAERARAVPLPDAPAASPAPQQDNTAVSTKAASSEQPTPDDAQPVTFEPPLPETIRQQAERLLRDLNTALKPAFHHPLEHDYLVSTAGLVVFWPHLRRLFAPLLDGRHQWRSPEHQQQGLAQLLYLGAVEEELCPIAALLTGLPPNTSVADLPMPTGQQRQDCQQLLKTVVHQWRALKDMPVKGLRELFINRSGYLDQTASGWRLTTDYKPQDILLQALPWPVSVVHLPWMTQLLAVEWHTGPEGVWRSF